MSYQTLLNLCRTIITDHPAKHYIVGYSGGRDSHVLLDICYRLSQAQLLPKLSAIHVNHQLNVNADAWAKHCQAICQGYGIPLITETIHDKPNAGDSIEAFARQARYAVIHPYITHDTVFLSAHHQRDQAETFLLQLMRGAGLDGLRAMPVIKAFGKGHYLRPFLTAEYSAIVDYANDQQLDFIEDDSNNDTRFDRNYVRHEILPVLENRFPQACQSIATSAAWLAEVEEAPAPESLPIEHLQTLPKKAQKQQIRAYIKSKTQLSLSQTQIDYILSHHLHAARDKHPLLTINHVVIRRHQGHIIATEQLPQMSITDWMNQTIHYGENSNFPPMATLTWQVGQGMVDSGKTLTLQPLNTSEHFHPHTRHHSQSIKKLLLEYGIPSWLRTVTPGIYAGSQLIAIPGIGISKTHYSDSPKAMMPIWQIAPRFVRL